MGKSLVLKVLDRQNNLSKFSLLASRFSLLASRFSLFVILMSLYLIPLSTLTAQVIIKEKVEINPQNNVLPDDPQSQNYSLCNGFPDFTVVWYGEGNNYGINYNGGPGVNINVSVIQGAEYVKLYLSSVPNSWGCDNFSLMPDNFNYSNMLCITAEFNETEPIDTAIVIIKFTNLADPSYIDYNKFIVVKPMYHLEVEMATQLNPGDLTDIIVQSFNQCGDMFMYCNGAYRLGDCLPGNVSYNVQMISGFEFGYLKNTSTGEMGFQLTNLIPEWEIDNSNFNRGRFDSLQFVAENYQLTEPKEITIRFSTNDVAIIPIDINLVILAVEQDSIEVSFEKSTISPGDTTRVFLKKKGLSGLQDFPPDKLFNVEIIDGIEYGLILDSLSNDTLTTFSNIPQGFKIIAKDSTGIDSTKIRIKVTTEDDGIPVARMIKNNTNTKITEKAQTISEGNDHETILPDFGGIIPGPPLIEGFGDVVVKEDECDEEIVVCETLEPQELKNESFIKLRRNKDYDWIDKGGVPHTSNTGNGCLFQPRTDGRLDMGKCYVFEIIGNYAASSYPYYLLDDAKIKACINKNDPAKPHWQFNLENLKIPVFADICQEEFPDYYVDLIDGTLAHCLSKITRCEEVKYLFEDIEFLEIGPYRQPNKNQKYPFYYSNGILAHEDAHYDQTIKEVVKYFKEQKIFENIRHDYVEIFQSSYPCPEDAINFVEKLIKQDLRNAILAGSDLYIRMGYNEKEKEYQAELDADEIARKTYEQIRTNLNLIRSYLHCN